MTTPQPGDRIRLVAMPDNPDSIPIGATGAISRWFAWISRNRLSLRYGMKQRLTRSSETTTRLSSSA